MRIKVEENFGFRNETRYGTFCTATTNTVIETAYGEELPGQQFAFAFSGTTAATWECVFDGAATRWINVGSLVSELPGDGGRMKFMSAVEEELQRMWTVYYKKKEEEE